MTTRETSREAFKQLVESGALKGKQRIVLEAVHKHGPGTSAEIIDRGDLGENVNLVRARFTELQARGLIVEVGVRKCKITGRAALVWEYSGRVKPLEASKAHAGVSKKTLAVTLERICGIAEHAEWSPGREAAIKEARQLAARA